MRNSLPLSVVVLSLFYLPPAIAAQDVASPMCNGVKSPVEAKDLGANQAARKRSLEKLCGKSFDGSSGEMRKSLDQLKQKLQACGGSPSSSTQVGIDLNAEVESIEKRLRSACNGYKGYVSDTAQFCTSYGAASSLLSSANKAGDSCQQEDCFKKLSAENRTASDKMNGFSNEALAMSKELMVKVQGLRKDKDDQMTRELKKLQAKIDQRVRYLRQQAAAQLAARQRYATNAGGASVTDSAGGTTTAGGGKAMRWKNNSELNKFYKNLTACEAAGKDDVTQFHEAYQKDLGKPLVGMKDEGIAISKDFANRSTVHLQQSVTMDERSEGIGTMGSLNGADKSDVSGGKSAPADGKATAANSGASGGSANDNFNQRFQDSMGAADSVKSASTTSPSSLGINNAESASAKPMTMPGDAAGPTSVTANPPAAAPSPSSSSAGANARIDNAFADGTSDPSKSAGVGSGSFGLNGAQGSAGTMSLGQTSSSGARTFDSLQIPADNGSTVTADRAPASQNAVASTADEGTATSDRPGASSSAASSRPAAASQASGGGSSGGAVAPPPTPSSQLGRAAMSSDQVYNPTVTSVSTKDQGGIDLGKSYAQQYPQRDGESTDAYMARTNSRVPTTPGKIFNYNGTTYREYSGGILARSVILPYRK